MSYKPINTTNRNVIQDQAKLLTLKCHTMPDHTASIYVIQAPPNTINVNVIQCHALLPTTMSYNTMQHY